ncbi:preprotein translocase subunit TatA [Halosolutus amylolyticus]|uniref:Preprotein translocase subunit TatA n=1 Tax=Halosolutus amylolyticus TaxID=2932267 RepID=A0ABD5PSE8_9EURY|nr:hypothetical protein [Halosolutus amylolyticus]
MIPVPLFVPGAPGGPELLIVLFMMFFVLVPIVAIGLVVWILTRDGDDSTGATAPTDGDVAALEQRVAALERRVEHLEADRREP